MAFFDKRFEKEKKISKLKKVIIPIIIIVAIGTGVGAYFYFRTYSDYKAAETYETTNELDETQYFNLGEGYIKYSNDGVSYLENNSVEWTESFDMTDPVFDSCDSYVAVGEIDSNTIYIFSEDGLVSEVSTSYPLIDVEITDNGVIAALMEESGYNYIEILDTDSDVIAEGRTTFESSGYPMDIAISSDGSLLAVSYLSVSSGYTTSRIVFYDYSEDGDSATDRITAGFDYDDSIIPTISFIDDSTLCAVGENIMVTFSTSGTIEEEESTEIDEEIQSVFFGDDLVGIVTESTDDDGSFLISVYDEDGDTKAEITTDFDYTDIKFTSSGVLLYNSSECKIYSFLGREIFDYSTDTSLVFMQETLTENKYIFALSDETEIIKLK